MQTREVENGGLNRRRASASGSGSLLGALGRCSDVYCPLKLVLASGRRGESLMYG